MISYKGGIHDFKINDNETTFAIVSGPMPSYVVLYNSEYKATWLISNEFRNQVAFAPNN